MKYLILLNFLFFFMLNGHGQTAKHSHEANEISLEWMKNTLKLSSPRLIFTREKEEKVRNRIKSDSLFQLAYRLLLQKADIICSEPLLERQIEGRRMLRVSREAVRRISTLAFLYRIKKNETYLKRLNDEIEAVSGFEDWNPAHFLDVGEMAFAVAIGIDWCGDDIEDSVKRKAFKALKEKAMEPSLSDSPHNWWINSTNNWNQVCHSGLSAAALVTAEEYSELATKIIGRAVDNMPTALKAGYAPHGAYLEGPSYWNYGTAYTVLALTMFETALDTDFELAQLPGFIESALFRMMVTAPSGECFNYFDSDCQGGLKLGDYSVLSWFAQKLQDERYVNRASLIAQINRSAEVQDKPTRFFSFMMIWLASTQASQKAALPEHWIGKGENPVVVFRKDDPANPFFLAAKGGSGSLNHGNMDAGSFVLEMGGVRWSVDPGNQSYNELEQIMGTGALWDNKQESPRWKLLTKNNFNHSTLTVNDQLHNVNGMAFITDYDTSGIRSSVTFDLSEIFNGQLASAQRTFSVADPKTIYIEDAFDIIPDTTDIVTWRMMTTADVTINAQGVLLRKQGKELLIKVGQPEGLQFSAVSRNPPLLPYDKRIEGLKSVELNIPAYKFQGSKGLIQVELILKED